MKIGLNEIRFTNQRNQSAGDPAPEGVDTLIENIGAQLGAIEEVIDVGSKYQGILVIRVVSCVDHPNADRLHLCTVDDGGKAAGVERDDKGYVQVVCGAPNVHEGMLAVWLPPGSVVPSTVGKDPFVLEARKLRGVVSNGMLASPKELAIGDSHEGILEVDKDVAPGTSFAKAYGLDGEVIIDIENKMFTHRPDCFGSLGVARELEGIQHRAYKSPSWYTLSPEFPKTEAEPLSLQIRNELPELVPRFTAITMRDVEVKESPVWLQIFLSQMGMRPINNIVDYTNYFMLVTGQPLHAYDYDKVRAQDTNADHATIVIRNPKQDEKLLLLNGKEVVPRSEAIMIATRDKLIGIGGVMGGGDTEVDENTKNIIIECATFDMYSIRRTSMTHGLFTDAVTRFNKGQSPLQNLAVLAAIVDEIRTFAGGKVASTLIDDNHLPAAVLERGSIHEPVTISAKFINARLGLSLSADEVAQLLENVEFIVQRQGDELTITAPFWRTDIEIKEDIVEEVGRLYGYDKLPLELPRRTIAPATKNATLELKQSVRTYLAKAGANEVLTYSFVHGDLLRKVGQNPDEAFQVGNALSPDLQYYRLSIIPSLLDKVHMNIKAGYDTFALFELGKAHHKTLLSTSKDVNDGDLPIELERLSFVFAANSKAAKAYSGAAYYEARKYLTGLLAELGMADSVTFEPLQRDQYVGGTQAMIPYYTPGRSAAVLFGDTVLGEIGEFTTAVHKNLKLPEFCAGFELDVGLLALHEGASRPYAAVSRFPKVTQDITFRVPADLAYQKLYSFVTGELDKMDLKRARFTVFPLDIYQRQDDHAHKQVTLRLEIASYERTLTDTEVSELLHAVANSAQDKLKAVRV